jgi:RimJ/RimL family protein N-acetyltransferase
LGERRGWRGGGPGRCIGPERQGRAKLFDPDDTGRRTGGKMPLRSDEIHIESERLSIRPFSADDADATFRCITPSLTRFMSWEPPADKAVFDRIWQGWLPTIADGTDFTFAIRQRVTGGFLGLAGLHSVRGSSAELGIWIREDCHAQGLGREAVRLVARWASLSLGIASFTYPVAEENYPSRRLAESLGGVIVDRRETPKYRSVIYRIPDQSVLDE